MNSMVGFFKDLYVKFMVWLGAEPPSGYEHLLEAKPPAQKRAAPPAKPKPAPPPVTTPPEAPPAETVEQPVIAPSETETISTGPAPAQVVAEETTAPTLEPAEIFAQ